MHNLYSTGYLKIVTVAFFAAFVFVLVGKNAGIESHIPSAEPAMSDPQNKGVIPPTKPVTRPPSTTEIAGLS